MTAISISTDAPRARPAGGLRSAIGDALTITQRNLITLVRVPQLIVFSSVQPILFVLMFRYAFGGAIPLQGGIRYVDYLMPGIYGQVVAFGAINTGIGLAEDKGKGLIERMRSLPMARSAVLAGRTFADVVRNAFVIVLMVVMGFIVGFRLHNGVVPYLGGLLLLLLFGFALSWIFALIGLSAPNAETAQAAAFPILLPLVFASSAFVPLESMPGWLQVFSAHQPVTQTIDAMRALVLGGPAASHVLQSLAWSIGIVAVFAPLAVRRYRRAT
jgi:ABC-2 type transport system permease protein/oleandomycin transport system permease protein